MDNADQIIEDMWNLTMSEQEFKRRMRKLMRRAFMSGWARQENWEHWQDREGLAEGRDMLLLRERQTLLDLAESGEEEELNAKVGR